MIREELTPDDIDELARRAQGGDRDAMEQLLTAVRPRCLNVCRQVLPYTPDAEDACQEALINIANKIGSWGRQGRFTTWMHVVAVNSARTTYRRMKNQAISSDVLPAGEARPAHHQRHRRHPPRPARGDGDHRARPPAVRRAADPARRLRHVVRRHRRSRSASRSAPSRRRSTTAGSSRGRCSRDTTDAAPADGGSPSPWRCSRCIAAGCGSGSADASPPRRASARAPPAAPTARRTTRR